MNIGIGAPPTLSFQEELSSSRIKRYLPAATTKAQRRQENTKGILCGVLRNFVSSWFKKSLAHPELREVMERLKASPEHAGGSGL
jgi:hypothetical protein